MFELSGKINFPDCLSSNNILYLNILLYQGTDETKNQINGQMYTNIINELIIFVFFPFLLLLLYIFLYFYYYHHILTIRTRYINIEKKDSNKINIYFCILVQCIWQTLTHTRVLYFYIIIY